ncbi:MAG: class I SAM-dependent methyltransferase [Methylobacter sp.]|nr:class I SAM-dependent methyltransferase [Methylobacter sp.]
MSELRDMEYKGQDHLSKNEIYRGVLMEKQELETFYSSWSNKELSDILFDLEVSKEKIFFCSELLKGQEIKTVLEIGCGFGGNLDALNKQLTIEYGLGVDFSKSAIDYANLNFATNNIHFHQSTTLDIETTVKEIQQLYPKKFDLVVLVDLLEHIPNVKHFLKTLSPIGELFLVKLPIENNLLENYIYPRKIYPSINHPNGHLREFDVNSVNEFITHNGFAPIEAQYYATRLNYLFPRKCIPKKLLSKIVYFLSIAMTWFVRLIFHKKLALKICPGGNFIFISKWSESWLVE